MTLVLGKKEPLGLSRERSCSPPVDVAFRPLSLRLIPERSIVSSRGTEATRVTTNRGLIARSTLFVQYLFHYKIPRKEKDKDLNCYINLLI